MKCAAAKFVHRMLHNSQKQDRVCVQRPASSDQRGHKHPKVIRDHTIQSS